MDLMERVELFIRFMFLSVTMLYLDPEGSYFQKQIKRINTIVCIDGDKGFRLIESESCSVVEGVVDSCGIDEDSRSDRTGESHADSEPSGYVEKEPYESGHKYSGVSDDSLQSRDALY
jgi:hypothetical protein